VAAACPNHLGQRRTILFGIGLSIVMAMWVLSLIPITQSVVPGSDKWHHFIAYAGCTFWWCSIYTTIKRRALLAVGFALMGGLIEVLQGLSGYRYFEWADMGANALGALAGGTVATLLPLKFLRLGPKP
jgi:VanZ family protein